MGRIFIKTVNGREYRYERIETKRVGKRVMTKDKYLGAVAPVQNKMSGIKKTRVQHYRNQYAVGGRISDIRDELKRVDGVIVSEATIRKHFKDLGVTRAKSV